METGLIIRSRHITDKELHQARSVVAEQWEQGRVAFSRRQFCNDGRKKDVLVYPLVDDFRSWMQYIVSGGIK